MPVSSGSYAVEQVAKWNWYYRMVIPFMHVVLFHTLSQIFPSQVFSGRCTAPLGVVATVAAQQQQDVQQQQQ